MMTVCFDGAGKDSDKHHHLIAVVGLASFEKIWEEFENRWLIRLQKDDLEYFHAGQFAHSQGPFRDGWKGKEERRRLLCSDLFSIIEDCGLRKFGCIIRIDDYRKVKGKHSGSQHAHSTPDPFAFAAMDAAHSFHEYARGEGIDRNVECVFEKGDPEESLRQFFRNHGYLDPHFRWSTEHIDHKGVKHDPFIGLQAAGWIAYEYYLDSDRILYSESSDRWALRKFEQLPGNVIMRFYDSLEPNLALIERNLKKKADAVRDSVIHLEKIADSKMKSKIEL